jgi:hypothetical protein
MIRHVGVQCITGLPPTWEFGVKWLLADLGYVSALVAT